MAGVETVWAGAPEAASDRATVTAEVTRAHGDVEGPWRALEREAIGGPFQRFDYFAAWDRHVGRQAGAEPLIVTGRRAGRLAYVLPLTVERCGPFRVARFAGGSHANYNTGLFDRCSFASLTPADVAAAFDAIARSDARVDLLQLSGQPAVLGGRVNPFVTPAARPWMHQGYEIDLSEGFDAVLARHRGGKKKKRERQQARAFQAIGDMRFTRAETAAEARRILDAFAEQKSVRLAEQGLPDIFSEPGVMPFFHETVERSFAGGPATLECYGLEVAGRIRATFIVAPFGGDLFGLMNSIAVDDLTNHSPGDYLTFHLIQDACNRGFTRFDFGIGDARYKRSWVDGGVLLMETLVPFTLAGRVPQGVMRLKSAARDAIVARPGLHRLVQRLRRLSRRPGSGEPSAEDAE